MNLWAKFAEPPKPGYLTPLRYWFLAFFLALLAFVIWLRLRLPPSDRDRNLCLVFVLMGLFNHLAYNFRWRPAVTVSLRALACVWLAFFVFCIFYYARFS